MDEKNDKEPIEGEEPFEYYRELGKMYDKFFDAIQDEVDTDGRVISDADPGM